MKKEESDIFIVDNSGEWKVQKYLAEWCELSKKFDIATGYFEIGSLLNLDGAWITETRVSSVDLISAPLLH